MKIIKAQRNFHNDIVYINAEMVSSFHPFEYEGQKKTKIYFESSKCEINGDWADLIADYMAFIKNGVLDLTKGEAEEVADEK